MSTKKKDEYDCSKCPGWCCSYERIPVTSEDIKRLARHLEGEIEDVREHCLDKHGDYLYLRHKKDTIFKSTCVFFDRVERRCGVYEARPWVCRRVSSNTWLCTLLEGSDVLLFHLVGGRARVEIEGQIGLFQQQPITGQHLATGFGEKQRRRVAFGRDPALAGVEGLVAQQFAGFRIAIFGPDMEDVEARAFHRVGAAHVDAKPCAGDQMALFMATT